MLQSFTALGISRIIICLKCIYYKPLKAKSPVIKITGLLLNLVELAGFEPASKQVAKLLSTCLSVT